PSDVLLQDIDDDGNLDILTSNANSGDISVLTGNGSGGFTAQTPLTPATAPAGLAFSENLGTSVPDTTAPALQTAEVDGASLTLTYDEALDGASDPLGSDYGVTINGVAAMVTTVDADGTTVSLTLDTAVAFGDVVTVDYTPGGTPVQDEAGNDAIALSAQAVTNNTAEPDTIAPVLQTAVIDGMSLVLSYDEALDGASDPVVGDYVVSVNGVAAGVSTVDADGTTVNLSLLTAVNAGDTVTVDYTPGGTPVQDIAGNDAIALSAQA
ncbi:MAG: SwmB domain-containing protein, partial [Cyanobacteria bacterium J06639_14]